MDNSFENSVDNPDWVNYGHAVGNCGRPDIDVSPTPGSGDMKMSAPMLDTQTSAFGACADNQTQDDLYSASPPRQYSVYGTNRPVHGSTSTKDSGEQLNSQQAPPTIGGSYEGLPTMQGIQEDTPMPHHKPSILDLLPHDPMSNPTGKKGPINTMLEKKHKSSKATPSLSGTNNLNSEAESSNSQKRHSDSQVVIDDPAHVDAAMRDGEEDHSWMNEGQDSDDEYEELLGTVNKLKRRQLNGKITEAQRVDLYKLQKHLTLKQRLRDMAKAKDDEEESLFVPETREDVVRRHSMGVPAMQESQPPLDGDEEHDLFGENPNWADKKPEKNVKKPAFPGATQDQPEDEDAGFMAMMQQEIDGTGLDGIPSEKELNKRKKPRKKAAKNAREFYEREREVKERKKQKKEKGRQPAAKAHAGGKTAAKGGKASKKGNESVKVNKGMVKNNESLLRSQGYNRNDGMDDVAQMIIQDLINHDPITDRITDPIFDVSPEEEISGANNKATQLQRLFANIPQGSNTSKAKSDKAQLLQASRSFGYAKVRAVDGKWLVKGMKSTLYHHQLLGANWMLQRELNGGAPFGGLLADSMGLGKTVQTLACMVGNPAQEDDRKRGISSRATLIVVPSAVIDQWMDEIRYHAEESAFPKIMHYRAKNKIPRAVLEDLDVVVTSYNEVMRQFPFPNHKDRVEIGKMGYNEWWKKVVESQLGDLHSIHWYRVVLDEAQAIKNNSARTSLACQALKSVYRWCLTGTPLLNRLEELFPYLRFLKANYSLDWKTFQRYFCDPEAEDCHKRIATLLSYTMMRRTMKTTILNRPIITLPPPHPEIQYIDFSAEERIIYRITESRFRTIMNRCFAQGTAVANYAIFLVQLLRLRQCTSHPFMLERTIKESWTSEDVQELRNRLAGLQKNNTPFYEQCQLWVTQSEAERRAAKEAKERGEMVPDAPEIMPFGRGNYGHNFKMDKALASLSEEELFKRVVCGVCSDIPGQPTQTDCGHIFCKECLHSYMHRVAAESDDGYFACPTCDRCFTEAKPYEGLRLHDDDNMDSAADDGPSQGSRRSRSKREADRHAPESKGADAMGFEPQTEGFTWVGRSDFDDDFPLVPSAKTATLKAILLKSFQDAPSDKVVVYVQFRVLARIVGRICHNEKWGFLYLTGDSTLDHRTKAVKLFRSNPDVKILIAGLKCGGLGLNFPWANRCISLDLWWNHGVEQQAFGRIFRIGQKKETYMTRVVVRNSVDMRLLSMQMYKMRTCDRAMGESGERPSLGLADLARLFGFLRTDQDDNILSVEPDYDDEGEEDVGVQLPMGNGMGEGGVRVKGDQSSGREVSGIESQATQGVESVTAAAGPTTAGTPISPIDLTSDTEIPPSSSLPFMDSTNNPAPLTSESAQGSTIQDAMDIDG